MDWKDCAAVEIRPDIHGGAPILRGTRLTVEDSILGNLDAGVPEAELPVLFPVLMGREAQLREVIRYSRRATHAAHSV